MNQITRRGLWRFSLSVLIVAMVLALGACSEALSVMPEGAGARGTAKSIIPPTLISDNNATISELLPAGSNVKSLKLEPGALVIGTSYGPLTITGFWYQDGHHDTTVGTAFSSGDSAQTVVGVDFVSEMTVVGLYVKGGAVGTVTLDNPDYDPTKPIKGNNTPTITKNVSGGYLYSYDPGVKADTELTTAPLPNNPNGFKSGISHLDFAWVPTLLVSLNASTSYDRDWNWNIAKGNSLVAADPTISQATPVMLDPGRLLPVTYTVTASAAYTDFNFKVFGAIRVINRAYNLDAADIGGIVAQSSNGAPVSVAGTFPSVLPAGSEASFAFESSPAGKSAGTITALVSTTGKVLGDGAGVGFAFGDPARVLDQSIAIADSLVPAANRTMSLPGGAFSYDAEISSFAVAAVATDVVNTATFTESDSGRQGSASSGVWIQLRPSAGYLRSMGYWKTHAKSSYNDHPTYDSTWDKYKAGGVFAPFYKAAPASYIDVMWTAPKGNAYYNLATQYVGAKLNVATGFAPPAPVAAAIARAEYYYGLYSPAQMAAWKSTDAKNVEVKNLAGILEAFNTSQE